MRYKDLGCFNTARWTWAVIAADSSDRPNGVTPEVHISQSYIIVFNKVWEWRSRFIPGINPDPP